MTQPLPIQYASAAEFDAWALPAQTFRSFTAPEKDTSLQYASRIVAGYVRKRKTLPLLSWGEDIKAATCQLAAYDMMSKRGQNPAPNADAVLRERRDDAIAWLVDVSRGLVELDGCVDSSITPDIDVAGPLGVSDPIVNFNYQTRYRGRFGCRRG